MILRFGLLPVIKGPPLYMGNPKIGTFTNSEDPDEMRHNVAEITAVVMPFEMNKTGSVKNTCLII